MGVVSCSDHEDCHIYMSPLALCCFLASAECGIALREIGLHLLLSAQLISQWQDRAGEHKSHILSPRYGLNLKCLSLISNQFWAMRPDLNMPTHTVLAQMGFHIWLPGAVVLALKTAITSVTYYGWLYWSFSAIMQYGHEWWANMNPLGGGSMRPMTAHTQQHTLPLSFHSDTFCHYWGLYIHSWRVCVALRWIWVRTRSDHCFILRHASPGPRQSGWTSLHPNLFWFHLTKECPASIYHDWVHDQVSSCSFNLVLFSE